METNRGSNNTVRWIQRGVIAIAVVALLAGAAYVWGNRLSADTLQTSSQRTEASGSLSGLAAVRSVDAASRSRGGSRRAGARGQRGRSAAAHRLVTEGGGIRAASKGGQGGASAYCLGAAGSGIRLPSKGACRYVGRHIGREHVG